MTAMIPCDFSVERSKLVWSELRSMMPLNMCTSRSFRFYVRSYAAERLRQHGELWSGSAVGREPTRERRSESRSSRPQRQTTKSLHAVVENVLAQRWRSSSIASSTSRTFFANASNYASREAVYASRVHYL